MPGTLSGFAEAAYGVEEETHTKERSLTTELLEMTNAERHG